METARRRLMQNQPLGTEGFTTAPSSPRSTIPLPRRNATPAQTTSDQSPTQPQHRPGASVASSPPGPSTSIPLAAGSAVAPIARAASPARTGEKLSTPYLTCKQWDVQDMVKTHSNFRPVRRVSALAPPAELLRELAEYEKSGLPLIIEDWHKHPGWKEELLGIDWLLANVGDKEIPVRNVHNRKDTTMKMSRFVEVSRAQDVHHVSGESERYYWKDGECPSQWKDWLQGVLPAPILPGSRDDLLRHLLPSESVETLLCYLGVGDTYTPAHKDLCASSGHNLMCFSEDDGSSFWFMTASDAAPQVAEYFQKELGQELDWETHVTTVDEWGRADFNVYVAEQKVGDLVLVPPRSVHQVVNRGGLAMKLSWSRMAPTNLKTALWSELPIYRRVCRPEQYRVKTVLYRSLLHYADELRSALGEGAKASNKSARSGLVEYGSSIDSHEDDENPFVQPPQTNEQLAIELWRLVHLFDDVLKQEHASCHDKLEHITRSETSSRWSLSANDTGRKHTRIAPPSPAPEHGSDRKSSYNLACDFCGADIFQSFFECQRCRAEDDEEAQIGDGLLVCPACYVEGRTCSCDDMHPRQCRPFDVLLQDRNEAASLLSRAPLPIKKRGGEATSPLLEKHLKGLDAVRVFEAACALRDMKINRPAEKLNGTRRCRSGHHHDVPYISGLGCSMCHASKCYLHLLGTGTHCAQALLASRISDTNYHEVHKNNSSAIRQHQPHLYDVDGSDVKDRLLIAAKSFPRCKPGHPKLQLGWYDSELEVADPILDTEMLHPVDPSSQSTIREDSPLTPISSPAKDSDSSPNSVPNASRQAEQSMPVEKDDDSVISIDSDSDDHQRDVPVTRSSSPVKRKVNRAYVELKSVASLQRTSSPASVDLEPRCKKRRLDKGNQEAEASTSTRPAGPPLMSTRDKPFGKRPSGHIRESYGSDLASVLSRANGTAPIFTQPVLPDRSVAQHQGALRRIISPDPEESTPPLVTTEPSSPLPRSATGVSTVPKSTVVLQASQTSVLPAHRTATRQRSRNIAGGHDVTATLTTTIAPEQAPAAALPRNRKRPGPPGIRRQDFQTYVNRRKQAQREGKEAGKTALLQEMEVDKEERIEVDDSQELLVHPRPTLSFAQSATSQGASIPSLSQTSFSSTSSLTVSTQIVGASPERVEHPSSSRIASSNDIPSVPGPSQANCHQPHRTAASSSGLSSTTTGTSAFSNPLRALADTIDSIPDFLRPAANPELERAIQCMKDEIQGLRAELKATQSRDAELERRVKYLEDEKTRLQETLQRERTERSHAARSIRELDDRTGRLEKKSPPYDAIERYVRETVASLMPSLMPSLRGQLQELANHAVHDAVSTRSVSIVQTMALLPASQPPSGPFRQQIDSEKPIPQGPAGYPHPNNRQYGRGGPSRNHGPYPQDQYQSGSRDGRSDRGHFHSGPRYQGSSHSGTRDDDNRQSHPRPTSSGSHSSSENGRPVQNYNNWSRRQAGWDNDNSRRADSPRRDRDRSRSPDRRKDREPTLDYIEPEPMPRLRSANWGEDHTSSIHQFDDGDEMRAVGGSGTDPELSPISSFPPSDKSRAHSEIQDSSFTERDARNEDPKPPSGPRSSRRPARSPERGRGKSTSRPIRQ